MLRTNENVGKVTEMVRNDHQLKVQEMAEELNMNRGTLTTDLNIMPACSKQNQTTSAASTR
jgi:predicted transcriptional regulator